MAEEAHRRYAEIMQDVEDMIDDHSKEANGRCSGFSQILISSTVAHQKVGLQGQSKLKLLVPSIGTFFTRLPLADAFRYQDKKRFISSRRFVPPSFNDIRLILNTAQLMGVIAAGQLELATFDGDVTLYDLHLLILLAKLKLTSYDDGKSLEPINPVIQRIIRKSGLDRDASSHLELCKSSKSFAWGCNSFYRLLTYFINRTHESQHENRYCNGGWLYRS